MQLADCSRKAGNAYISAWGWWRYRAWAIARPSQGFTLLENLIILIIAVILVAITAANFFSLYQKEQLNKALNQTIRALEQAQREAIRKSKICTISMQTVTSPGTGKLYYAIADNSGCLVEADYGTSSAVAITLPEGISLTSNLASNKVTFGIRGTTTSAQTIVLSSSYTQSKKCIDISIGLGLMRTGEYNGTGSPVSTYCQTSE